jgi:REP element-mobilizing transposase RayT
MAVYCMPDHVHLLISMKPDIAVSDLVRDIKANSSLFIKENYVATFSWQKGFGAFSYAKSQLDNVARYIANQPQHHQKTGFKEEYIEFLDRFQVEYDDKYLFEFY